MPENRQFVRGFHPAGPADAITVADYPGAYYPVLANDVAAARAFLERKNDAGECNAARLIVVGAGEGATLAALWLASECARFRPVGGTRPRLEATPAAEDVLCAVWLSPGPSLGDRRVPVVEWLKAAGKGRKVAMAFLHGEDDSQSGEFNARCVKALESRDDALEVTAARGVKGTGAAGMALLDASSSTTRMIRNYIANVREDRGDEAWDEREFKDQAYVWSWPPAAPVVAKFPGEAHLRFLPFRALGIR